MAYDDTLAPPDTAVPTEVAVPPDATEAAVDPVGTAMLTFGEEMALTPRLLRWTIYISLFCLVMLFIQCVVIMPLILGKYGWGYSVN
jgi:hypothetical protein